ncbi:MAG: MqnA/MqnD/SBP family protein, partial [Pseudomonadota bacterium]
MQNHRTITVGISTCPNDTFSFHALLHGIVDQADFSFSTLFEDVETLNQSAMQGTLDVAKVSFHAAGYLRDQY